MSTLTQPIADETMEVRRRTPFHSRVRGAIPLLAGIVLLVAAGWKVFTAPTPLWALSYGRWGEAAYSTLLAGEIALGLSLLLRVRPRWMSPIAAVVFLCFALYSLNLALRGAASCGCFGTIQINPWVTAVADLILALALGLSGGKHVGSLGRKWVIRERARVIVIAAFAVGIGIWQFSLGAASRRTGAEGLTVDLSVIDLGRITESQARKLTRSFTLRNDSHQVLKIDRVDKACTCTSAKLSAETIPPGGEAELTVEIDWTGRRGPQRSDLWVVSYGSFKVTSLTIQGTVDVGLAASPREIRLGQLMPNQVLRRTIDFVCTELAPSSTAGLRFNRIDYACSGVKATEKSVNRAAQADLTYELLFEEASMPADSNDASVTFHPADSSLPVVKVGVTYARKPCLVPSSATLRFRPKSLKSQVVRFKNNCADIAPDFKLKSEGNNSSYAIESSQQIFEGDSVFFEVRIRPIGNLVSPLADGRLEAILQGRVVSSVPLISF